jgi:hypothetical protein
VRSHDAECEKLSFKLKFDEYEPGARFDGLKRLNLHASSGDATLLRELMAYRVFRDFGVDAPRAVPARLYVNGEFRGLFIAVEAIDGRYTQAHFPQAPDGNLYKEIWPNALFPDEDFLAALETNEELGNVSDMRRFADAVTGSTPETFDTDLEPFIAVESVLRYIAVDRALRNWDGIMAFYSRLTPHNFYWYRDDGPDPRFHLIPWDLDNTLWAFDPYMHPEQWVTAPPIPDFNSRPIHCEPRPVWDLASVERVTPPRCDRFLDSLAENHWQRLVDIGQELLRGPLAAERLLSQVDEWSPVIAPIVEQDPTLDTREWQRALSEFREIIALAGPSFQAFLAEGLIDEPLMSVPEEPAPEELGVLTPNTGLHIGTPTNFEFAAPPATPEPAGVFTYGDPLAVFSAAWSTEEPIAGTADLRFDFTFNRGPALYDEWAGIGLASPETDVSRHSAVVVWLAADVARQVRVRFSSPVYEEVFGGAWSEFGVDTSVGPVARAVVINFADLYYPTWAKEPWGVEQGFPGTDLEALELVLQRFDGLIFGPGATVDPAGELSTATEVGYLRIDNIYFR